MPAMLHSSFFARSDLGSRLGAWTDEMDARASKVKDEARNFMARCGLGNRRRKYTAGEGQGGMGLAGKVPAYRTADAILEHVGTAACG